MFISRNIDVNVKKKLYKSLRLDNVVLFFFNHRGGKELC